MSSQVMPLEFVFQKAKAMPDETEDHASLGVGCIDESKRSEQNANDELLRTTEDVYSLLLKIMKLFGAYFGDTNFSRFSSGFPGQSISSKKQGYVFAFYSCLVVAGLWLNFAIPLVSMFHEGPMYLLLFFDMWCMLVALNGTVCLIVLPLTASRKSRFEKFISNLRLIHTGSVNLQNVKSKTRTYLIIFCFFIVVVGVAGIIILDQVVFMNAGTFKPWNVWIGFRIINNLFLFIGIAFWLLPMVFYCITCLILEALFDDLHMRKLSLDLSELRDEHHKLCRVVELADSLLSPLLFMVVGLCIPFICFALYHIVHLPESERPLVFLLNTLIWLFSSSAILAVVMVFGSKVNDKVRH